MSIGRVRTPIGLVSLTAAVVLGLGGCGTPPPRSDTATGASATPTAVATPDAPSTPLAASTPTTAQPATPTGTKSAPKKAASKQTAAATKPKVTKPTRKPTKPPQPTALMRRGDQGEQVRELQHRLIQLRWYAGSISGRYDDSTAAGVSGFQRKRGLDPSGRVDQRTWDVLVSRTARPTRDQMHNVVRAGPAILQQGSTGDQVRDLQARLKQIGWYSGNVTGFYGSTTVANVRGFQDKRGLPVTGEVDSRSWDRLVGMTREPTRNEKYNVQPKPSAAGLDSRCLTGRALCISKSTNKLVWVIDGRPQLRLDVRFGSQELPTREGSFAVGWKSRNHVSTIYHTPMPYAMFFSGGQAVHYSPDFAARGYSGASHGCVNVRDRQAIAWLFETVRVGDKVIVYR